ncbi:helix-turn-helix transcriptional regulator [Nakamurella flavida]|uniref:Helix-turn-helix transcriptional regulator n=1 Tax=Nakamurella flavida TaxID=363630 RepID=A0A938YNR6_9ACTN|nr:helix-turn-helix transcriptional regulator [Nakamurella flavida]MBM9478113.1 helix-turn-helix transcriptional regulator [Nakamurella flavida]MDP9778666.1 hypothetical protein [Nakamurella flavida]
MVRRARGVLTVEPARALAIAVLDPVPLVAVPAVDSPVVHPAAPAPVVLFRHALGSVLRVERTAQGRTLQQVARAARVSVAFVSEVERGMKQPSSEILAALTTALEVSLSEVVARSADLLRQPSVAGATQLRAA